MSRASDYLRRRSRDEALLANFETSGYLRVLRRTLSHLYGEYAVLHDEQNLATRRNRGAVRCAPPPGDPATGERPLDAAAGPAAVDFDTLEASERLRTPPTPFRSRIK